MGLIIILLISIISFTIIVKCLEKINYYKTRSYPDFLKTTGKITFIDKKISFDGFDTVYEPDVKYVYCDNINNQWQVGHKFTFPKIDPNLDIHEISQLIKYYTKNPIVNVYYKTNNNVYESCISICPITIQNEINKYQDYILINIFFSILLIALNII